MKQLAKKLLVLAIVLLAVLSTTTLLSSPCTHAEGNDLGSCRNLLGLTSWDCGISSNVQNESELTNNVILIATNIMNDLSIIAAYLVLGFVIYGGYQYIFSSGDVSKTLSAKRTLTNAFIGLGIVMLASVIFGGIRIALIGNASLTEGTIKAIDAEAANALVTNLIQWTIGIAGIVAAIFLVLGGVSYMTSAGDSSKLQKAKNTILYAIIGLIVVALAEIITAFVSNAIRNSDGNQSYYTQTIIAKELNEK